MEPYLVDISVAAAGTVLLVSGFVKIALPGPITATLVLLWNQVSGDLKESEKSIMGRALGLTEVGLAVFVLMGRSLESAIALVVFAVGLAGAGLVGALGGRELPCACFGGNHRTLGYSHVLQFPLWAVAAWCAASSGGAVGSGLGERTALLVGCIAAASAVHIARMWVAVSPITRQRRRSSVASAAPQQTTTGTRLKGYSW